MSNAPLVRVKVDPMTKARAEVVMNDAFFGTLLLRMRMKEDPTCQTLWTDGVTIGYNPEFIAKLSAEERRGVLVHEIMHPALLHHIREGNRNHAKWNIACDYALNPLINQKYKLPKSALVNPAWAGKSADEIYTLLPDPPEDSGSDAGGCGEVRPAPGDGHHTQQQINKQHEAEWKQAIAQARYIAKQQGTMPAEIEKLIDELMEPIVPWRDILRRFCTEVTRADESWNRGNRRFLADGPYLPGRQDQTAMGAIVFVRDTSGSIYCDPGLLSQFNSELKAILDDIRPSKTYVIDCDAAVQEIIEIDHGEELPDAVARAKGGGGTDFRPPFVWLDEQQIDVKCVIYLTDGEGTFPREEDVPWPTLWAISTKVVPPFGERLQL